MRNKYSIFKINKNIYITRKKIYKSVQLVCLIDNNQRGMSSLKNVKYVAKIIYIKIMVEKIKISTI